MTKLNKEERSKAIRALMSKGIAREDANLIVDISAHAMSEAQETMMRTIDNAPLHLRPHIAANAMIGLAESMIGGLATMQNLGVELVDLNL